MNIIDLRTPEFLNLDEIVQDKIIADVSNGEMTEHEKQATVESMIFLRKFQKKLKENPNITLKQVKRLFKAHEERLKKILLTQ